MRKRVLQSHPDKNNHPQASDDFRMINEVRKGLKYLFCHNYAMMRTQKREEDLQHQEYYWRKDEQMRKAQEKPE